MIRPEFVKDQASQRLYFDAARCEDPAGRGRPSSTPSVQIKDKHGATIVALATTNVTQEGPAAATITATASAGATQITLSANTGVVPGKTYWAKNKYGQVTWLTPSKVPSSGAITLNQPLAIDFDLAVSTSYGDFQSTRWYYTLQSADVDTLNDMYVAVTTYAYDSLNHELRHLFDVVRHPLANPLTAEAVQARRPDIVAAEFAETRGSAYDSLREQAWGVVRRAIRRKESAEQRWRPGLVIDVTDLFDWGIAEFELLAHQGGVKIIRGTIDAESALDRLTRAAHDAKAEALTSLHWLAFDDEEATSERTNRPLMRDMRR